MPSVATSTDLTRLQSVVAGLRRIPTRLPLDKDKLPDGSGFYCWWSRSGSIPLVPSRPHPVEAGFDVLYVGIAPSGEQSTSTVRRRVWGNHLRGNIAASTFRLTLASFLREQLELVPIKSNKKTVLTSDHNKALSRWQVENLALTCHEVEAPWLLEAGVIAAMRPPLNIDDNHADTFCATVQRMRTTLRELAEPAVGQPPNANDTPSMGAKNS
jgi:hypothetical protein